MPITKHNFIVKDVTKLADTIRRAFKIAQTGRPGPVLIDIPKDVTANKTEYVPEKITSVRNTLRWSRNRSQGSQIQSAKKMLIQRFP